MRASVSPGISKHGKIMVNTKAQSAFCPLFSSVWIFRCKASSSCSYSLRAGLRRRGNSGPARMAVYFVPAAFAHKRSILMGCLLLDTIIRKFSRWIQTIYLLQRLVISFKLNLVSFLIKNEQECKGVLVLMDL